MNIDKNELINILNANSGRNWTENEVSDKMVADFNKEYGQFLKIYPDYDPLATDDYHGKRDDDFLEVLVKTCEQNGCKLFESASTEIVGHLLVESGWPEAYGDSKFAEDECESALDEEFAPMSWEGAKKVIGKFPSRMVRSALNTNYSWKTFKEAARPYLNQIAAFCLGPKLDGNLECWMGHDNAPSIVRNIKVGDLGKEVITSIMEALVEKHPMTPAVRATLRHKVIPNLHMKVYESNLEMDATEFADIAAALNDSAQNLASIVHGFVEKALSTAVNKAMGKNEAKKDEDDKKGAEVGASSDDNQKMSLCYHQALDGGMNSDEAISKCADTFGVSIAKTREVLTAMNVNLGGAATTTATNSANSPAPASDPNAATAKEKNESAEEKTTPPANQFTLHVNKQYQTTSGQVLTLRKMSGNENPHLVFEDENTGERVEMMKDKFLGLGPKEADINDTKSRRLLINKFKKRINLSAMKKDTRFIVKTKGNRKIYENLDSIKSEGRPVGDIAGVVIGTSGNKEKSNEFVVGQSVKAGDVHGVMKGFKINENAEPEIIVKTPEGDEVTITVSDFVDSEPVHMEAPADLGGAASMDEHLEYKGYSLLQNAEDQTWSVLKGEEKQEGAEGMTEDEAKAWVDAKLEEEGGEVAETEEEEEEGEMNESISRRFITESKDGSVRLKTFSQVLSETKIPSLKANLINPAPKKKPETKK